MMPKCTGLWQRESEVGFGARTEISRWRFEHAFPFLLPHSTSLHVRFVLQLKVHWSFCMHPNAAAFLHSSTVTVCVSVAWLLPRGAECPPSQPSGLGANAFGCYRYDSSEQVRMRGLYEAKSFGLGRGLWVSICQHHSADHPIIEK